MKRFKSTGSFNASFPFMIPLPISTTFHATRYLHPTIALIATLPWMRGAKSHAYKRHEISYKVTKAPKREIYQVKFTVPNEYMTSPTQHR